MSKVNTRGIESAHKCMLMAAIAYNLKKNMKYVKRDAKVLATVIKASANGLSALSIACFYPIPLFLTPQNRKLKFLV